MLAKLRNTFFALVVGGLAGWAAFHLAGDLHQHWRDAERMREWVLTRATVPAPVFEGVAAEYRYQFDGRAYVGTKLGVGREGSQDFGYWREDMIAFLNDAQKSGKPVSIYVNPDRPAESVVDREVQGAFLMWMAFLTVSATLVAAGGLSVIFYTWVVSNRSPRAKDWRDTGMLWLMALLWSLPTFAIGLAVVPQVIEDGEWAGLLVLIFPLIGVLLLVAAIAATFRLLTGWQPREKGRPAAGRGGASLSLDQKAPRLGETLEGTMTFPGTIAVGENMRVRLVCNEKDRGQSRAAWFRESIASTVKGPDGPLVRFSFDVPAELPTPQGATLALSRKWRIEGMQVAGSSQFGFPVKFYPAVPSTDRDASLDRIFGAKR